MQKNPPPPMVLRYFLLVFLLSILMVGRLLWPFLSILVLSFLLAGIFKPVYAVINRKLSPFFSSLLTCTLIIVIVFVPLAFFVGALSQEAYSFYQWGKGANLGLRLKELHGSAIFSRIQEVLDGFGVSFEPEAVSNTLSEFAKFVGLFLYNQATSWAANIMNFIFSFFLMIISIFFLLIDSERLFNFIQRLSPLPWEQERQLIVKFEKISWVVLVVNGLSGLIQGILGGIVFAVFDLGPPVLWGGIMGILAFLPIFGIGLVLIPAAFVLFFKGSTGGAVFLFFFYLTLSFSIEYILKPKLVGNRVKMHTLLVFLSIMGGLSVFGFLGIIYGPLIITAFLTLAEIYIGNYDYYVRHGPCGE